MNRMFSLCIGLLVALLVPRWGYSLEPVAYGGEPLSLNFQDVEVRSVLKVLADFIGVNLVASDAVQGKVTLRLHDVPWEQALDLVLRSKGLGRRQEGSVLLVAPLAELAAHASQARAAQAPQPLVRELLTVSHARAGDIVQVFQAMAQDDEPGSITVDERTNTIVARQPTARLADLRQLLARLDVPVRQVMIEARIVEANVDYEKSLGVRWGGAVQVGGGLRASGLAADGQPFVDLGVDRVTSGIGLGLVRDSVLLDLELSAMEKTGNGEIISQPKVVTADKETARILKGTEVPYQESGANGSTSTTFREASLSLEVTPQITADNRVIMTVKVTKDEPDYLNALNDVPPIRKNEVNAKVQVGDGETIVIGGVYATVQSNVVDKVPFFGDVPYVGRLFRRAVIQEKKSELLVFLTPRIMSDQAIAVSR